MFKRAVNVVRSWFQSTVENLEDPAKVAKVLAEDDKKNLKDAEYSVATLDALVKQKERNLKELRLKEERNKTYLDKAVNVTKDEVVATHIAKDIQSLRSKISTLEKDIEKISAQRDVAVNKVRDWQDKQSKIADRIVNIEANQALNKATSKVANSLGNTSDLASEMDRLESKVDLETLTSESLTEIRGEYSSDKLVREFKDSCDNGSVEDILNEIKRKE